MVLNRDESNLLKGCAMLMVMSGHFIPQFLPFAEIYVPIKRLISQVGVELFLMVTGYGVYSKYILCGISPKVFLLRRLVKIWPLYFFVITVYFIINRLVFGDEVSIVSYLVHCMWLQVFFGFHNDIYSASHYFSALFIVYFISVLVLIFRNLKYSVIIVLCITMFHVAAYAVNNKYYFPDYLASFTFGILIAAYFNREQIHNLIMLVVPIVFCFGETYSLVKFIVGLAFFLSFINYSTSICHINPLNKILFWFGINSYVLYLGHNYFTWKWPQIVAMTGGMYSAAIVIISGTFLWLFILFQIYHAINDKLVTPAKLKKAPV